MAYCVTASLQKVDHESQEGLMTGDFSDTFEGEK